MLVLKILGLISGAFVVLLGGAIALSPARQYLPELGSRATETVASSPAAPVADLTSLSQLHCLQRRCRQRAAGPAIVPDLTGVQPRRPLGAQQRPGS
jgi:hypothetical protein